ncbi:MAG: ORF6N domain-containing protein [Deltaproteobacteria bacterium]|nr:ORF6N domain-containing protein [Deltaproteobacteria bacterium]
MGDSKQPVPVELIENKIYLIRGQKVMLDRDLAELYGIETKQLKRAVKRNIDRFPTDFMFVFTSSEYESLRCQSGTLNRGVHSKYLPFAFTEQGVAMLSSVLNSKQAIQVNIQIMRVFTRFRQILLISKDIRQELDELKRQTNDRFHIVFETLDHLLAVEDKPNRKIGFTAKEKRAVYVVR